MFDWKVRFSCSSVMSRMSSSGCCSPALLTSMSSRPNVSMTFCTAASQNALSPRSPGTRIARRPSPSTICLGLLGVVMLAQIEDRDVGAFAGVERGDRAADAAVGAGDDRDLALEPVRPGVARFPFGFGGQRAFVARQAIFVDHRLDGGVAHRDQPWRAPIGRAAGRLAGCCWRSAEAGAAAGRHSATIVGKSNSVLVASAASVAAAQAARLS